MEGLSGMGGSDTLVYGKNAQGLDVNGDWPAPAATDGNDTMIFKNGATVDDVVTGYGGNDTFDGVVEAGMKGGRGDDTFINGAGGSADREPTPSLTVPEGSVGVGTTR
jgi:hypothetical protein